MFIFLLACVFLGCSRFDSSVFKYVVDYEQRDSHETGKKQDKKKKFRTGCLRFLSVVQDLFHTFTTKENGQCCRSVRRICLRRKTVQNELFRHTLKMILGLSESKLGIFFKSLQKLSHGTRR